MDSGGSVKAQNSNVRACDSFETNLYDVYGNPADIGAGDRVKAEFGGRTTTVDVPAFDVTSNPKTDKIKGNTDATVSSDTPGADESLAVWPQSSYD
jgi:hypothetical protein